MQLLPRFGASVLAFPLLFLAMAASIAMPTAHAATRATPPGHVTILVLDMSGSMAQNDPAGLRCSAANAYIDLSGPNDFVGVVGLDNTSGATGGPHGFVQAQTWSAPTEMATVAERAALRQVIATKSNGCKPDGNTPTYDALNQALGMLAPATHNDAIPGSVILLTDGEPFPSTSAQESAITSDLAPQFKSHGWPVDTVALGPPGNFHTFLSTVSDATAGKFYDDGKGVVPGISPLNLAPFFVDLFALRNGRTPGTTIPPTSLGGGTISRNFTVGHFVSHLDVITVKDQPGTRVTLTAPNGEVIAANGAGAFVSSDPHYVIFSIDAPQSGAWQINVTGSGQFLMDSLLISTLTLDLLSPSNGHAEPLGQPITITAALRDQGSVVAGQTFDVRATVSFVGNGTATPVEVLLSDSSGSGNYSGTLTIPLSAPAGTYQIAVTVRSASENAVTTQATVQFERFPAATLLSPTTGQPTTSVIPARVVQWDAALRFVYATLPFYSSSLFGWHPSDWPLQGLAASPNALIGGKVLLGDASYSGATVQAIETPAGNGQCTPQTSGTPVQVINDPNGAFRLLFPTGLHGAFCVTLTTTGSFKDSFGDLTRTASPVAVSVGLPSLIDELRAWGITTLYTAALAFILIFFVYGPINFLARPKPSGRDRLIDLSARRQAHSARDLEYGRILKWGGWSLRRYFRPNRLPGGEVALPNNLLFIFRYGGEVAVNVRRPRKNDSPAQWKIGDRPLTASDGSETIIDHSRLSFSEASMTTDLEYLRDAPPPGTPASGGNLRDQAAQIADRLPGRGRTRKD